MDRIGQISNTLDVLKQRQITLSSELANLIQQKSSVVNDLNLPDKSMKLQASKLDTEISAIEAELKSVEGDIGLWTARLDALQEAGKREAHDSMVNTWNERQMGIYDLLIAYNEGISQLNELRIRIHEMVNIPEYLPGFYVSRDSFGAQMWPPELLPRCCPKIPRELSKIEIYEGAKFL